MSKTIRFCFIFLFVFIQAINVQSEDCPSYSEDVVYSFESLDYIIIRETARSPNREHKLISLEHIREVMFLFDASSFFYCRLFQALEYLAFEGFENPPEKIRYRQQTDFPDVRIEAVELLGMLNSIEARAALFEVLIHEDNPDVLREALKSIFLYWNDFYNNEDEVNIIINAIQNIKTQHIE